VALGRKTARDKGGANPRRFYKKLIAIAPMRDSMSIWRK
jgi:hypothetical protein